MIAIWRNDPIIVFTIETKLFKCDYCNSNKAEIFFHNTKYNDLERNIGTLCEKCQAEDNVYWDAMWKEYYGGLL